MNILELEPSQRNNVLLTSNLLGHWCSAPVLLAVPGKILYQTVILGVGPAKEIIVQRFKNSFRMQVEQLM